MNPYAFALSHCKVLSQDPSSRSCYPPPEGDSIQVLPAAVSFWKRERYRLSYRDWALLIMLQTVHFQSRPCATPGASRSTASPRWRRPTSPAPSRPTRLGSTSGERKLIIIKVCLGEIKGCSENSKNVLFPTKKRRRLSTFATTES